MAVENWNGSVSTIKKNDQKITFKRKISGKYFEDGL